MSGLGKPWDRRMQPMEELPQMDGSCDACEPDEAQPATQMCCTCSFAFCTTHGTAHGSSTRHPLSPYSREEPPPPARRLDRDEIMAGRVEFEARAAGRMMKIENFIGDHIAVLGEMIHQAGGAIVERVGLIGERPGIEAQNGLDGEGAMAEGAEAGEEAVAAPERGKKDTVTVERLRCTEHGQEGSLYCKADEKIICVVCAVQGDHREHEIITLHEAYLWQKNREGYDLLGCTRRMSEKMKTKWTNPEMTTDELEAYVNSQFDELRRLARLEEKRTLHLVDLKEAFLTAHAAEKIAEINVHTERLEEEMASITHQLDLLDQVENNEAALLCGPARAVLEARPAPRPGQARPMLDIEARPRLPQPGQDLVSRHDYEENEPGPAMYGP